VIEVKLAGMGLVGTLPTSLVNLTYLSGLELSRNLLRSKIPGDIGQISPLAKLLLDGNQLTGTVPLSAGYFTQLVVLDLSSNQLNGTIPPGLGAITPLVSLRLHDNHLWGSIPASLGQLGQLLELNLEENLLSGTIPSAVGDISDLKVFKLGNNLLNGSVPISVVNLKQLQMLKVDSNALSGPLPDALGQCSKLRTLAVHRNRLTGTVPGSIGLCTNLSIFYMGFNALTGTIPRSLGQCEQLTQLSLESNDFSGPIPGTAGQWPHLQDMHMNVNRLTGAIPAFLGELTHLTTLALDVNFLSGSVPHSLGSCSRLVYADLGGNELTGPIPSSLGQLSQLVSLYLQANYLTGGVPDALSNCSRMGFLSLDNNLLNGTVPPSLAKLSKLRELGIYGNALTGTVPDLLAKCTKLESIHLHDNHLSGLIPNVFQLTRLQAVTFQNNKLNGTLPVAVFSLGKGSLQQVLFDGNRLTGTIPGTTATRLPIKKLGLSNNLFWGSIPESLVSALHAVDFLFLDSNRLTGIIPQNWSAAAETISYLYLHGNCLSGPIPESLGYAPLLQNLNLSSNRLTGTIPASFQHLNSLQVLMLHNNHLRGNVEALFNTRAQGNLSTVQLSNNQLTGTLPAAAFLLPSLSSFAAVDNCFEGPLPEEAICGSASLSALVLDGLHSAKSCKRSGSLQHSAFKLGTLPPCLLTMPGLVTLHLSGSGLTGSFPSQTNISATLADLSLSHNLLTGDIPSSVLARDWVTLDISYNRLSGTLNSARVAPYNNNTKLYLQHNRLSGVIPASVERVSSLSLVQDNMFSCRVDRSDVPKQDTDSDKYTCGSDAVNSALYAWFGAVVVMALITSSVLCTAFSYHVQVHSLFSERSDTKLPSLHAALHAAGAISAVGTGSAAYCILVLLPVYVAVNTYHPTFTYKYAWTVSGVFLTGTTAFALEAVFLLLHLLVAVLVIERLMWRVEEQRSLLLAGAATATTGDLNSSRASQRTLTSMIATLVSLTVVTGINVGFVFATLRFNGRELTIIQILLAVFKLAFNNIIAPALENRVKITVSQVLMVLMNVIAIPCLVLLVVSPACYFDSLTGSDPVTTSYKYSGDCLSLTLITDESTGALTFVCKGTETAVDTTTYTPPFTYSYQCSSSFVTSYAPTYVIMCIISGFVAPAYHLLLLWLRNHLTSASRLYPALSVATPPILMGLPNPQDLAQARSDPLYRPVFDVNKLVMSLLTYLALLLTFGALFPPLAVCCAVAMASVVLSARLEVGRYVSAAVAAGRQDCLDEVESACAGVTTPQQLRVPIYVVVTASCMFYALFLFDTLGYEVGFAGAFWVLIVVPLVPVGAIAPHVVMELFRVLQNVLYAAQAKKRAHTKNHMKEGVELGGMSTGIVEGQDNPMHTVAPV
jgi:Leucine-rich repeat (LRR) protein